jgi:hypothetical protein
LADSCIYVVRKKGRQLSGFAEYTIDRFRRELTKAQRALVPDPAENNIML